GQQVRKLGVATGARAADPGRRVHGVERRGRRGECRGRHPAELLAGKAFRGLRRRGILRLPNYAASDQARRRRDPQDRVAREPPMGDRAQPGGRRQSRGYPADGTRAELPVALFLGGRSRAGEGTERGDGGNDGGPARRRTPLASGIGGRQLPGFGPGRIPRALGLALRGPYGHHWGPAPHLRRRWPALGELLGLGAALPACCPLRPRRPCPAGQTLGPARDERGHLGSRTHRQDLSGTGLYRGLTGFRPLLLRPDAGGAFRLPGQPRGARPAHRRRPRPGTRRLPPRAATRGRV
ncbi:PFIG00823557: AC2 (Proteasome assembly chaperone) family, partial [uncultured Rubrobacteraceae bacterium]